MTLGWLNAIDRKCEPSALKQTRVKFVSSHSTAGYFYNAVFDRCIEQFRPFQCADNRPSVISFLVK